MIANKYLATIKSIQDNLLNFLENSDDLETEFLQFTDFLVEQHIQDEILKDFLNLISKISLNHQRTSNFIKKIENILIFLKKDILSKFTNTSLFNVFQNDKRILLFLFKNQFLKVDDYVYDRLVKRTDFVKYFTPELLHYQTKETGDYSSFDEIREKGENDSYLCELIRDDSIKELIIHINKTNLSIKNATIRSSFFETNAFLLEKKDDLSLIEYAVFFGSVQTVQYLLKNDAELKPSLWFFAIHSNNPEMIHLLEENYVLPNDNSYQECFKESIKCFHNDVAHYIQDNLLQKVTMDDDDDDDDYIQEDHLIQGVICYNFEFCPKDLGSVGFLHLLCTYDYLLLAKIIIKNLNISNKVSEIVLSQSLYGAIKHGNQEIVQLLLTRQEIDINLKLISIQYLTQSTILYFNIILNQTLK